MKKHVKDQLELNCRLGEGNCWQEVLKEGGPLAQQCWVTLLPRCLQRELNEPLGNRHWLEVSTHSTDSIGAVGFPLQGRDAHRNCSTVDSSACYRPNALVKDGAGEKRDFFHCKGNKKQGLNKVATIFNASGSAPSPSHRQPWWSLPKCLFPCFVTSPHLKSSLSLVLNTFQLFFFSFGNNIQGVK